MQYSRRAPLEAWPHRLSVATPLRNRHSPAKQTQQHQQSQRGIILKMMRRKIWSTHLLQVQEPNLGVLMTIMILSTISCEHNNCHIVLVPVLPISCLIFRANIQDQVKQQAAAPASCAQKLPEIVSGLDDGDFGAASNGGGSSSNSGGGKAAGAATAEDLDELEGTASCVFGVIIWLNTLCEIRCHGAHCHVGHLTTVMVDVWLRFHCYMPPHLTSPTCSHTCT